MPNHRDHMQYVILVVQLKSNAEFHIVTLKLKQTVKNPTEGIMCEKIAHMHLVDLAGSERQAKTKAQGANLKEAAGTEIHYP